MWYRDEQLAGFRIAELRAEADRLRLEKGDPSAPRPARPAIGNSVLQGVAQLGALAGRGARAIARALGSADGPPEVPAAVLGGRGHNR